MSSRRSGLGKGLSSLIPPPETSASDAGAGAILQEVAVSSIRPNPHQPRRHFEEEALAELTASIQQIGVLQPILVRPVDDGYELIAGERRWRAAGRAGLATIPAVIRVTDDLQSAEQALVENLQRRDLTALEEAAAYQQLIEDFSMTHDQVAERVGKSRSAVTNTLRLLALPPKIQRFITEGQLSAGHARALLATPDRAQQEKLAQAAVDEDWSVRAMEEAVKRAGLAGPGPSAGDDTPGAHDGAGLTPATRLRPPGLLELEDLLSEHLATRVKVTMSAKRGRLVVDFADLEDLERIYRRMIADV